VVGKRIENVESTGRRAAQRLLAFLCTHEGHGLLLGTSDCPVGHRSLQVLFERPTMVKGCHRNHTLCVRQLLHPPEFFGGDATAFMGCAMIQ
jgi:hypothetical protein